MSSGNLSEADKRCRAAFGLASTAMAFISPGGSFIDVNSGLCSLFGYRNEDFSGMAFLDLFPAEHQKGALSRLRALVGEERMQIVWERRCRLKNGATVSCRIALTRPETDEQLPGYFLVEFHPFPVRKEESRPGANDLIQAILDSMVDGVIVADDAGKVMLYNPAADDMLGEDLINPDPDQWHEHSGFFFPDGSARYAVEQLPLARAIRGETVDGAEVLVRRQDGMDPILIRATAMPLKDGEGDIHGGVTVFGDITARKRFDEALEVQSQVLKNMAEGVSLTDADSFIRFTNPAMEEMFGYGSGELVGQHSSVLNTYATDERNQLLAEQTDQLRKEGVWIGEMSNRHKDGRIFTTSARLSKLDISGSCYWVCVQEDITERKRTEEALRQSEERFAKVFRSSPVAIFISTQHDGRVLDMNDACLTWLGYQRHEVIGHTTFALSLWENVADREEIVKNLLDQREVGNIEKTFCTKTGEQRDAMINAELFELGGESCVVWITYDITERKRADERIKSSLREKEVLLQEIHHRVKNNLQVISSLLNLQSNYITDDMVKALFRESQDRVKSMALIHEKLYKSNDLARIDFSEYVHSLVQMLFHSCLANREEIQLKFQVESVFLDIDTAIPVGLMLNELISNSLKHAFPTGGPGTIYIDLAPQPGDEYELTIRDDGVGVPENFDVDTSDSLGLRLVRILTKQIGGTLEFRSGNETEFKISFQDNETAGAASRTR